MRIRSSEVIVALLVFGCAGLMPAQSLLGELKTEHDPAKRSEMALTLADTSFDNAHDFYTKGQFEKGNEALDNMTSALSECVSSLAAAHKARYYKHAELKVAYLQRRMKGLLDDISIQQRGWADQMARRLDEIHDKLLDGVMKK
jgi:hypothetical protein